VLRTSYACIVIHVLTADHPARGVPRPAQLAVLRRLFAPGRSAAQLGALSRRWTRPPRNVGGPCGPLDALQNGEQGRSSGLISDDVVCERSSASTRISATVPGRADLRREGLTPFAEHAGRADQVRPRRSRRQETTGGLLCGTSTMRTGAPYLHRTAGCSGFDGGAIVEARPTGTPT